MTVLEMFDLGGKVAVVTGGAGRYGRQIVEGLAEAGARTYIASRDAEINARLSSEWQACGLDVRAAKFDQADEESIARLRDQVLANEGSVDILVNNAVLRPMQDWAGSAEDFRRSMEVNATGLFLITRDFGEAMATAGRGSIIQVSSIYGHVGPDLGLYEGLDWGAPPDYFFHKSGMVNLTRYAAAVLGPSGVRVNSVSPGGLRDTQELTFVERYEKSTFLRRMAGPSDLKGAIVFLASDASAYVTGADLRVDGGYTAR